MDKNLLNIFFLFFCILTILMMIIIVFVYLFLKQVLSGFKLTTLKFQ